MPDLARRKVNFLLICPFENFHFSVKMFKRCKKLILMGRLVSNPSLFPVFVSLCFVSVATNLTEGCFLMALFIPILQWPI